MFLQGDFNETKVIFTIVTTWKLLFMNMHFGHPWFMTKRYCVFHKVLW